MGSSHGYQYFKGMRVARTKVEQVLGKPLHRDNVVHHIDGDRGNDENSNFVICQDKAYHNMLHRRQRALEACGHAHYRKCWICKEWGDPGPKNMHMKPNGESPVHLKCHAGYGQRYRQGRR